MTAVSPQVTLRIAVGDARTTVIECQAVLRGGKRYSQGRFAPGLSITRFWIGWPEKKRGKEVSLPPGCRRSGLHRYGVTIGNGVAFVGADGPDALNASTRK